jgi:ankyrin repeat protein
MSPTIVRDRIMVLLLLSTSVLNCKAPDQLLEESPCGNYRVFVERHPMLLAMPGQGSDAPATLRITNQYNEILHKFDIEMVQLIHFDWQYSPSCTTFRQRSQDEICLPALPAIKGMEQRILTYHAIEQVKLLSQQAHNSRETRSPLLQLLRQIKDLNGPDQRGRVLLAIAVHNRNIPLIKILLDLGANINGSSLSDSPLHDFWLSDDTFSNDMSVLTYLLRHSPDLEKKNKWGDTVKSQLEYSLRALSGKNKNSLRTLLNL